MTDPVQDETAGADRSTWGDLYVQNVSRVRASIVTRKPFHCETDDLLQDTFLKAFRNVKSFRGEAEFATWVTRIAINTCFEEGRRRTFDAVGDEALRDVPGPATLPGEDLDRKRIDEMIGNEIGRLSEPVQEAVRLRFLHECSYKEISRRLAAPVGTVKTWVFRGRQQLRLRLRGLFQEVIQVEGSPC